MSQEEAKEEKNMAHLEERNRIEIEHYLNNGFSIQDIARFLRVAPSTISREIQRNMKVIRANNFGLNVNCKHRKNCSLLKNTSIYKQCSIYCQNYELNKCSLFAKKNHTPVCNSCPNITRCKLEKRVYKASVADIKYNDRIVSSRAPSRITKEQFDSLNILFTPLMKQGQSISVIYQNHKNEIMVSENTIRNYVRKGLFNVDLLDTIRPRFTSKTSKKRRVIKNVSLLAGRTYDDLLDFLKTNESLITQIDTVVGKLSDKKKLLTIHWPIFHFQIGILLDTLNPMNVNRSLINLKQILGDSLYRKLFQVIVSDNGIEFSLLDEIEIDDNGEVITRVFFCDPYNSSQKGACERNHEFIRYILPKGKSFDLLTQKDVDLIFSHINSTPRKSLGFNTPYNLMLTTFGIELLDHLNISFIPKDDVHLKPSLLAK